MTKFEDIEIKEILPFSSKHIEALSYAINRQIRKIKIYADSSRVYAMVDILQNDALDLLASELKTPLYDKTYDIEKKRTIIKNTLKYYRYMGTRAGIKALLKDVFGGGEIFQEWFEYDGDPYHYYISVASQMYSEEAKEEFLRKLKLYDRLSAWCDGVISATQVPNSDVITISFMQVFEQVEVCNV